MFNDACMSINSPGYEASMHVTSLWYVSHDCACMCVIPAVGVQVGNGCVGNSVGGCGGQTGLKIHVDFYHGHALFPDVSGSVVHVQPMVDLTDQA